MCVCVHACKEMGENNNSLTLHIVGRFNCESCQEVFPQLCLRLSNRFVCILFVVGLITVFVCCANSRGPRADKRQTQVRSRSRSSALERQQISVIHDDRNRAGNLPAN